MKIVVAGGSGWLGRALTESLTTDGHEVVVLSRTPPARQKTGLRTVLWDGRTMAAWADEIDNADAVVNLAGAPIGRGRWTASRKRIIRDSRVVTTRRIVEALGGGGPRVLVSGSAVGYYATGEQEIDESAPHGEGFLAETCVAWEDAARATPHGQPIVLGNAHRH